MGFWGALRRSRPDTAARSLYGSIVEQARAPAFFVDFGVPDTLDGRFEMIVLHAHLVFRRLSRDPADTETARLSQEVFDLMFTDMDQSLREMGVGDLSVGRKVRAMAEAFYGRAAAYDSGLGADDDALAAALRRNLYGTVQPQDGVIEAMARYVRRQDAHLSALPSGALRRGELDFAPAPVPEKA